MKKWIPALAIVGVQPQRRSRVWSFIAVAPRRGHGPLPHCHFDFTFELFAVFEGVADGLIDLIDAGLKGSVKIIGEMRTLIRHAELVNVIYGVYSREIETI